MPRTSPTVSFVTAMVYLLLATTRRCCTSFSTSTTILLRQQRRQCAHLAATASYLHSLNDAQVEAVTQPLDGITRVVAGPGAGKTRVLTCRIAHLLNQEADTSNRILAVTFTKKASGEMQERLKGILEQETVQGEDEEILLSDNGLVQEATYGMPTGLERVTLGTFHSICAKILRWNGKQLSTLPSVQKDMVGSTNGTNLDSSFAILDQSDQLRILREALKTVGIDIQKEKDLKPMTVLNAIGKLKSGNVDPKEVKKSRALRTASLVYPIYRQHLFSSNALDFDDLIYMARELLDRNETIRSALQRRWSHVLVDEFQDTSEVQLDLVKMWTYDSLLVVGDADQSIYSWRGAHVKSMSDFGNAFPDVHTVYLMENYRSTTNIVQAAQRVIAASNSNAASELRQDMKPMRGKGPSPRVLACANGKAEASYVVKSILGMIEQQEVKPDQTVAILYRTNFQSRGLEEACVQNNLPYVVRGSAGTFYSRAEIKDCLCFLRWLLNGRDQSAMLRAFKTPSKGLGDKAVEEFQNYCRAVDEVYTEQGIDDRPNPLDLLIALADSRISIAPEAPSPEEHLSSRAMNRFKSFSLQMGIIRKKAYRESVSDLISSVVETLGLEDHFNAISKSSLEFEDRWSNVQELRNAAEKYTKGGVALAPIAQEQDEIMMEGESPLMNFLDDVALVTDLKDDEKTGENAVKANLMTIHASKGMEFDVVFLVGNEDGTFPTGRAIDEGEGSVELDEERRLCYVAMTRAKNNLIMTWRREVSIFAGGGFRTVERSRSRFLDALVAEKRPSGGNAASGKSTEVQVRNGVRDFSSVTGERPRSSTSPRSQTRNYSSATRTQPTQRREPINVDLDNLSERVNHQVKRLKRKKVVKSRRPKVRAVLGLTPPPPVPKKTKVKITQIAKPPQPTRGSRKETTAPDSSWFYPVGSSVVHSQHGPGTVLPPPPDKNGELMVRVRFQAGGEVDLPAMGRDLFPN